MKVALVHDYLNEFGGAERVLLALSEIWPEAPIYTSFYKKGSSAWKRFRDKDVKVSWFHYLPFASKLASPLRFFAPLIWKQFNFSKYDVVITSANWFITKGVRKGRDTVEICYCHTPPRYLYGYPTSVEWKRFWPVRVYGLIVGHFLRMYDYKAAQRVDFFIANSKNTADRIKKFYRRESKVIYPPVEMGGQALRFSGDSHVARSDQSDESAIKSLAQFSRRREKNGYYLVVSRIVGGKGLELAIEAASRLKIPLRVVGRAAGWGSAARRLREIAGETVEFLGEVGDEELWELYSGAKAFLATAEDEDFGITPVEAMAAGTPVIAYKSGGYLESVIEGETGLFFDEYKIEGLVKAIKEFELRSKDFEPKKIREQAKKFSKKIFKKELRKFVDECLEKS